MKETRLKGRCWTACPGAQWLISYSDPYNHVLISRGKFLWSWAALIQKRHVNEAQKMLSKSFHFEGADRVKAISVLYADDHPLVRDAICIYLNAREDILVEPCETLPQAISALTAQHFDIALVDLVMPGMDGLASLEALVKQFPEVKIVAISGNAQASMIQRAFDFGIRGFIPKTITLKVLPATLKLISVGELFFPYGVLQGTDPGRHYHGCDAANAVPRLTPIEIEIISLVSDGQTNKSIAWKLKTTEVIIKMHMRNICRKIGARNRAHAAMLAKDLKIIE